MLDAILAAVSAAALFAVAAALQHRSAGLVSAAVHHRGASPVPAPTMIIGTCGFSGGRNAIDGSCTNADTVVFSGLAAR